MPLLDKPDLSCVKPSLAARLSLMGSLADGSNFEEGSDNQHWYIKKLLGRRIRWQDIKCVLSLKKRRRGKVPYCFVHIGVQEDSSSPNRAETR